MMPRWRPILIAAAWCATMGPAVAAGQTVIVRHAPAGMAVDGTFDAEAAVASVPDAEGNVRVVLNALQKNAEASVHIIIDACDGRRRVLLVGRDLVAPRAAIDCVRTEMPSLYYVRQETTIVVNLDETPPAVLIAQGRPPGEWLHDVVADASGKPPGPPRFVIFGGGDIRQFNSAIPNQCGGTTQCTGTSVRPSITGGATLQITRHVGLEVSYTKPAIITATGSGTNFSFTNTFDSDFVTVAGKFSMPFRGVSFYIEGGTNWHQATSITTEALSDINVTVGDANQTVPGGTTTLPFRTEGWGWVGGGGLDAWVSHRLGLYFDGQLAKLKGSDVNGSQAKTDQLVSSVRAGVRIRIGG